MLGPVLAKSKASEGETGPDQTGDMPSPMQRSPGQYWVTGPTVPNKPRNGTCLSEKDLHHAVWHSERCLGARGHTLSNLSRPHFKIKQKTGTYLNGRALGGRKNTGEQESERVRGKKKTWVGDEELSGRAFA